MNLRDHQRASFKWDCNELSPRSIKNFKLSSESISFVWVHERSAEWFISEEGKISTIFDKGVLIGFHRPIFSFLQLN